MYSGQERKPWNKNTKRLIFYCAICAIPLTQVFLFYFVVNANSFLLAVQKYVISDDGTGRYIWAGFENFKSIFFDMRVEPYFKIMFKNSLIGYIIPFAVTFIPGLCTSYYVYKKMALSKTFKVILFLPSILSGLAIVIIQKYILENVIPEFALKITGSRPQGLLTNEDTLLPALVGLRIWMGFVGSILLYPSAMSAVPQSVVESAKIDGCGTWREFWHIILPLIYPTLTTIFIVGLAGIFVADLSVFNLRGGNAEYSVYTVGYFSYMKLLQSSLSGLPYLSAFGLLLTIILVPIVFSVRWALNRFGPSVE